VEFQLSEVMSFEMFSIQFEPLVNLAQMKLMKMTYTRKNMAIQEALQSEEFQLIEVMKMKTQKT
jgi:hypothetical protein